MNDINTQKEQLIEVLRRDISDERVLQALRDTPREMFVPEDIRQFSYMNIPLGIGYDQTISQPYIVALMCEILDVRESDIVLDIGTGSGYHAAVLSRLCDRVISIEVVPELAIQAKQRLNELGYENIDVIVGDGREGYKATAPYDKITSAAATTEIPNEWKEQLKEGGRIVAPIVVDDTQRLMSFTKENSALTSEEHGIVRFVPLIST